MNNSNSTVMGKARNAMASGFNKTRSVASNTYGGFRSLSGIVQACIILVVLVLVVLLILWIYHLVKQSEYKSKTSPFLITSPINAYDRSGRAVRTRKVPNPVDGLEFTYSFWMYVANWEYRYNEWKYIISKGVGDSVAPLIALDPKMNSMKFQMATYAGIEESCHLNNIPLQKWVHIVYVLNNRAVDLYVDGKLERSCVLKSVPQLNSEKVKIGDGGGFYGQLAKMQYFTRSLVPSEVADIYSEGPYVSSGFDVNTGDDGDNGDNCQNDGGDDSGDNWFKKWTNRASNDLSGIEGRTKGLVDYNRASNDLSGVERRAKGLVDYNKAKGLVGQNVFANDVSVDYNKAKNWMSQYN